MGALFVSWDWTEFERKFNLIMRDYQIEAVDSWFEFDSKSILAMATGTGKTITAIAALFKFASENHRRHRSTMAVVICPYINLIEQWSNEFKKFGKTPILAFKGERFWRTAFAESARSLSLSPGRLEIVLVTQATLITAAFQSALESVAADLVIVGDEVHNYGSESTASMLPRGARARLGISATPERWLDQAGTLAIHDYFGPTSFELGIKEAIKRDVLCEYQYFPVICPLTEGETEEYGQLTHQLVRLLRGREFHEITGEEADRVRTLLRVRAGITGNAASKLPEMLRQLESRRISNNFLVYCAEGTSGNYRQGRQTDAVIDELRQIGLSSEKYDATTEIQKRMKILRDFRSGELDGIVSMRCLDEGVDVPGATTAIFLASSDNPRQFVQRRGRVLRKAPGKLFALIIDLFVVPSGTSGSWLEEFEKKIVERELRRADEFADAAINAVSANLSLIDIRRKYGLR